MQLLFRLRYLLLSITIIACILLFPYVKKAGRVDNSLDIWFLKDDPGLSQYKNFQTLFGNDEVVIMIIRDEQGLLSERHIKAFRRLSDNLNKLSDVQYVIGPGNTNLLERSTLGIFSRPLLDQSMAPDQIKKSLQTVPDLREQLFSSDFTTARLLIVLKNSKGFEDNRGKTLNDIKETAAHLFPPNQTYFGGVGVIYSGLNTLSEHDFTFFLFTGYLIMFVVLLLIHRSFLVMIYALGTVALSTYLTLGIYGYCDLRLNLMTVLLPIIFILLGIMDVMHIINEHSQLPESSETGEERALTALRSVFRPCLFTSLTTVAGFLASVSSPMPILRTFGIFAGLGIFFCLIFTYLLGVIILPYTKPHKYTTKLTGMGVVRFSRYILSNRRVFSMLSLMLILLSFLGIYRLKSDTYTLGYFPADNQVVKDNNNIEKYWGPYMPLELIIQPKGEFSLNSPQVISASIAFCRSVEDIDGIGKTVGFHSFYEGFLRDQYGDKYQRMLKSQASLKLAEEGFKQYYPALYKHFKSGNTGRITISGKMLSAQQLRRKTDEIMQISAGTIGRYATVTPAGYQPMYARIVEYVTSSQINSFFLSTVFIFALIYLYIKDFRLTIIALVPNLSPIIMMLGVMGWLNIYIDTATASIAAIVLGIAIDDTIHYIYHYKKAKRNGESPEEAREHTTYHVVPAIILTGILLICGYSFMLFASLKTVQLFGLLTAIAIIAGLYCELVIFPLLLKKYDKCNNGRLKSH